MTDNSPDFRQTWLWQQAFVTPRSDCPQEEQEFFKTQFLSTRGRVSQLVSSIASDFPGMTVHDISHLDALWDTASLVAEETVPLNPSEAFVLGVSILLHDAAMSLAAYPGGLTDIKTTLAWKDAIARVVLVAEEDGSEPIDVEALPHETVQQILPNVLRRLHAERAEVLAEQAWTSPEGQQVFLIEDADLRWFYGPTIGKIAHSHWWSVHKVAEELSQDLGALASRTRNKIDCVKLSCLLRVADAVHLDSRRAPRFLRAITNPAGISALHWTFQERLAHPLIESDAIVFTSGQPFGRDDAEAWWLAYDTLNAVDRELRDVDLLLRSRGRETLKACRVKGAGSPEILSQTVITRGWRPVDARLQVSDVPRIVENLGGSKLYGNDPAIALRELIQNAADAVQARRKYQKRSGHWGEITVGLSVSGEDFWLVVEDNGIGMSEQVLTGPLLDFGTSFWRSPMAMEEFPGLMASGMHATGRFGIGFFSVFMLGPVVRVYSRRFDKGQETGRLLEFRGGTSSRPILSPAGNDDGPIDGGTRVEVLLKSNPYQRDGLLWAGPYATRAFSLADLVGAVAPNLDVSLVTIQENVTEPVAQPGDWLKMTDVDLVKRLNPLTGKSGTDVRKKDQALMQPMKDDDGSVFGRAFIDTSRNSYLANSGWVTIAGLRATQLHNVQGILLGEATTAARDTAQPLVPKDALARWASNQAELISESILNEERQARSAEVILECGGDIGMLKIIRWGSDWLNVKEFQDKLRSASELVIGFRGEFEYDEDQDEVHPKEFREEFIQNEEVAIVLRHDGSILRSGSLIWPNSLVGRIKSNGSNVASLVHDLITSIWNPEIYEEDRVVGQVGTTKIIRSMTIFQSENLD